MAKPAITKRITKGSALTYSELDTNFQNIIDSILTVTDGTSDINLELIDTLELRGDHNIKVTATPSGNIVTIDNEIPTYTKEPSGFPNLTDTTISFNNGSRKFTITPTGASFRVWVAGEEFVKTTFEEITITNTTGLYSIYYDSTGQLGAKTTYVTYSTETPVAQVYWNATLGVGRLAEQRHGIAMDWATHEYLHRTRGAAYASGLSISNYTILGDGSVNSHAQFDLSSGVFFDEDLRFNITHSNTPTANFEQDLQGPARIPVVYHSGATGEWTFDTATDYAVKVGTIAKYNLNTAGTWTTPDITSTHYVAMWIVATNFISEPIVAIMGQRTDNKLEDAENNNTWAGLDLTNFPSEEFRPLYRIIFRSATTYTNAVKSYIAEVTDYRQTALGAGSGVALQANSFGTVSVSGQSDVIADQVNDVLTLVAGTGITLTTDPATDSVTIASAGTGTVNSGTANRFAYYPSTGTTIDDTDLVTLDSTGIIVGNNGLLASIKGNTSNSNGLSLQGGTSGNDAVVAIQRSVSGGNAGITLQCSLVNGGSINTYCNVFYIGTQSNAADNIISTYTNNSQKLLLRTYNNANIELAPNGTGQIDLNGLLKVANNTATPVNINQPISYLQVTVPVSARSAKTITANGNAASSATQSKFGGGSVAFDGTGDYLSITTQADFGFGTSDFTIEAWAYKSTASQQVFIDTRTASTEVSVYVESNAAGNLRLFVNGVYQLTSSNAMSTTTWQHIAISRCGGITRFFINGVVSTNIYTDTNDYGTTKPANIGASWTGGTAWNGYLDDIRITKGVGRYETSFIPPTVALKNDAKTVLLINGNTNITDDVTDNSIYYLPLYQ